MEANKADRAQETVTIMYCANAPTLSVYADNHNWNESERAKARTFGWYASENRISAPREDEAKVIKFVKQSGRRLL